MFRKTITLLLSLILLFSNAVQYTMAAGSDTETQPPEVSAIIDDASADDAQPVPTPGSDQEEHQNEAEDAINPQVNEPIAESDELKDEDTKVQNQTPIASDNEINAEDVVPSDSNQQDLNVPEHNKQTDYTDTTTPLSDPTNTSVESEDNEVAGTSETLENNVEPSEPECSCWDATLPLGQHADACPRKQFCLELHNTCSVEKLIHEWNKYSPALQEDLLELIQVYDYEKYLALDYELNKDSEGYCCKQYNEDKITKHDIACARYVFCTKIAGLSADEVVDQLGILTEQQRTDVLCYLEIDDPNLFEYVKKESVVLEKTSVRQDIDGTVISIDGNIPAGGFLQITSADKNDFPVANAQKVISAFDITIYDTAGQIWQPTKRSGSVTIAVDATTIGLQEGENVCIYHDHEGVISSLGVFTVTDGHLNISVNQFSAFYVVATGTANNFAVNNVIYFDLHAGDITISGKTYSGKRYENGQIIEVKGTLKAGESYYVYQSNSTNKTETGVYQITEGENAGKYEVRLPSYSRVEGWAGFICNNTNINSVIGTWETRAAAVGREVTPYRINVTGNPGTSLTIENLWSSYQENSTSRTTGSISYMPGGSYSLTIIYKGDNRLASIHYGGQYSNNKLAINAAAAADGEAVPTLTVCNAAKNSSKNYWNAAIGNSDTANDVWGLSFSGGNIYAATTLGDDCTAIGGGGNGVGQVNISNAIITAVSNSSGTAIGGGIGKTSAGGAGKVNITDSTVYAYNFSSAYYVSGVGNVAIPSAAIGGGSSSRAKCNDSTITISGSTVYALAVGGTAIGGGSSSLLNAGSAEITINDDSTVYAISTTGDIYTRDKSWAHKNFPAGSSIGGGTGGTGGDGGSCTLTIEGDNTKVYTGSIGGGNTLGLNNDQKIGAAHVYMKGGSLQGQVVMAKGGVEDCSFEMTGGTISNIGQNNTVSTLNNQPYTFLKKNGNAVYIESGKAEIKDGTIKNTMAIDGGAIYVTGGDFSMTGGTIELSNASGNGGAVCIMDGLASISGTAVVKNTGAAKGGAIYVGGGNLDIEGGSIFDCEASETGGAVCVNNGQVTINGGNIHNNTSVRGGGVYVGGTNDTSGIFRMENGDIAYCYASNAGGAVCVEQGEANLLGGSIYGSPDRMEAQYGGGIYVNGGKFTMNGEQSAIKNCNVTSAGGAVCVMNGEALLQIGLIEDSTADFGGGVYVGGGSFKMRGGVLRGCVATNSGGGVYINGGHCDMADGTIRANTANRNGGGIYVLDTDVTFSGTTGIQISHNTAQNGGGMYIDQDSIPADGDSKFLTSITNGSVDNNTATRFGGGLYLTGDYGSCLIAGTSQIHDNSAVNGGGLYIIEGSSLEISGGHISYNNAHAEENVTATTANDHENNRGVGGGIYVGPGSTMDSRFVMSPTLKSAGIYSNTASFAAGDIYADINATILSWRL